MTTPFDPIRAALERLVAADQFIGEAGPEYQQARDAARAALAAAPADGPAVPEGREPAVVAAEASPTTPPAPAAGEVGELVAWLYRLADERTCNRRRGIRPHPSALTRAAVLLERLSAAPPTPRPVAVSERLPEVEDTTEDDEVWVEIPGYNYPLADSGDYDWVPHQWVLRPLDKYDSRNGTRWLPAHALPLPATTPAGQEGK